MGPPRRVARRALVRNRRGGALSISELLSEFGDMYGQALLGTWWMSLVSFVFAMLLALVVTVFRVCPIKPLRVVGDLYVQIFRNIPGVSLLIILVYALPYLKLVMDYRLCVIVTVILVASAFGSENFMSGINTIGVGQIEAARSLGMGFGKMLRLVVIPQALRSAVLPMTNPAHPARAYRPRLLHQHAHRRRHPALCHLRRAVCGHRVRDWRCWQRH